MRLPVAAEQRSQHQYGCAHGFHKVMGRVQPAQIPVVHLDDHAFVEHQFRAHLAQQFHGRGDIVQVRDIADQHRLVRQQGRRKNGKRGILCARDTDLTAQGGAATDCQFIHERVLGRYDPECALFLPLFRRVGLYGKSVYVGPHPATKGLVHQLVLLDHIFSSKNIAHDDCGEMRSVTIHFDFTVRDAGFYQTCNIFDLHDRHSPGSN